MWSVPPAEPPPHETEPGSALSLATRSPSVWIGEFAGTTITSYSPVSRAIGVTLSRVTGDLLVRMAPTMIRPLDHQGVALALLAGDELGEADRAAGARDVDDLDAAGEARLLQGSLHGAARSGPSRRRAPPGAMISRRDLDLRRGGQHGAEPSPRQAAPITARRSQQAHLKFPSSNAGAPVLRCRHRDGSSDRSWLAQLVTA